MDKNIIKFENVKDFDLEQIFDCGQCFRWNPANDGSGDYEGYAGAYACRAHFDVADAAAKGKGGTLTLTVSGGDRDFWHEYFDLGTDYGIIKQLLIEKEPKIEKAIEAGAGIRILKQNLWETLISFIISQNNNIPRIKKCIEAICREYGERIGEQAYAFPTPRSLAEASPEALAELKLGYRCNYLTEAGRKYRECGCPSCMDDLLSYLGIGPKVANCIRLFGLRDFEAFPIDTWVKTIMNDMYGFDVKDVKGMQEYAAEKFGEYGGIAQQYLFNYYRNVR